jgi:hypothetical protein
MDKAGFLCQMRCATELQCQELTGQTPENQERPGQRLQPTRFVSLRGWLNRTVSWLDKSVVGSNKE